MVSADWRTVEGRVGKGDEGSASFISLFLILTKHWGIRREGGSYMNNVKDEDHLELSDEEIINFAKKHKVELIVMGTHGRTGVDRILFGSTAAQIVRFAPCPVLTVRLPVY